jgi:hypothetical protein
MNSNELRKQAESEENDLKAMGLYTKILIKKIKSLFYRITKRKPKSYIKGCANVKGYNWR